MELLILSAKKTSYMDSILQIHEFLVISEMLKIEFKLSAIFRISSDCGHMKRNKITLLSHQSCAVADSIGQMLKCYE